MQILTSYHAKAKDLIEQGLYPISISVQFPRYSKIKYPTFGILGPNYAMLKMSSEEYYKIFNKQLANLDAKTIYKDLERTSQGQDVVLLCYEADINNCHRKKVGEWFSKELDIEVKEVEFPKIKYVPKKPKNRQGDLFQQSYTKI